MLIELLDESLMEFLGWHYYATALDQNTVRSIIPMSSPTLYDLETSVAQVASTAAWAVLTVTGYYKIETGMASYFVSMYPPFLNINVIPASVGLVASIILLVLFFLLTYDSGVGRQPIVESCGILQAIWLSDKHRDVRDIVAGVEDPSSLNLRKAGLIEVTFGDTESENP